MIVSDGLEGMQMGVVMVWWNVCGKSVKIVTPPPEIRKQDLRNMKTECSFMLMFFLELPVWEQR
jgi:hypothetical protein